VNAADLARLGGTGLRTRRSRVMLLALGIAIGIATMVAVLGISASGQARLLHRLDQLGTNLLRVQAVQEPGDEDPDPALPAAAPAMIARIDAVDTVSAVGDTTATIRRTDHIPAMDTGAITVEATTPDLLHTLGGTVAAGTWLNRATGRYPALALGSVAADRLGIDRPGPRVWLAGRWFTVIGILRPIPLAPEIDRSALVGQAAARAMLGFDGRPTTVYERSADASVPAVLDLLPRTADPEHPERIAVSRPSDALAARAAAAGTFATMLLGLGAIGLLVGGIGVANTMAISVLERRAEIGLRRALGATRREIRLQFLTESALLSLIGGCGGVLLGGLITFAYAAVQGWPPTVPPWALAAALGATLAVGALAGLYPAGKAARLPPTVALRAD